MAEKKPSQPAPSVAALDSSVSASGHEFSASMLSSIQNLEQNRLSWRDDFFFFSAMSLPRSSELFLRINLNVPYYFYNYLQVMLMVLVPFLLIYSIPFLLLASVNCFVLYRTLLNAMTKDEKVKHEVVLPFFPYIRLSHRGHFFVLAWLLLFLFAGGVKTMIYVGFLIGLIVMPHALLRTPVFFDDEEMEKLRPKLLDYVLMLVFLGLSYLEGDVSGPELENNQRAEKERAKIKELIRQEG